MELPIGFQPISSLASSSVGVTREPNLKVGYSFDLNLNLAVEGRKIYRLPSALPETAASVGIAATIVGAATALLLRRTKPSEQTEVPLIVCEECGGSGICPECRGEGFVLKRMSNEKAEKARLASKNMATRYTAGLPKKWSYCTRCSSARSCTTCGGSGKLAGSL